MPKEYRQCGCAVQVDGLMWIANCVFQGSGNNGRAIDTNTLNGGTPALYIKGAPTPLPLPGIDPFNTCTATTRLVRLGRASRLLSVYFERSIISRLPALMRHTVVNVSCRLHIHRLHQGSSPGDPSPLVFAALA